MVEILAESDAGVDDDSILSYAGLCRFFGLVPEEIRHLLHDIFISGILLHRLRRPLHMHQYYRNALARDQSRHRSVGAECAHVVDDIRSEEHTSELQSR